MWSLRPPTCQPAHQQRARSYAAHTHMQIHSHSSDGLYIQHTHTHCRSHKSRIKSKQWCLTGFSSSCRGDGGMSVEEEEEAAY